MQKKCTLCVWGGHFQAHTPFSSHQHRRTHWQLHYYAPVCQSQHDNLASPTARIKSNAAQTVTCSSMTDPENTLNTVTMSNKQPESVCVCVEWAGQKWWLCPCSRMCSGSMERMSAECVYRRAHWMSEWRARACGSDAGSGERRCKRPHSSLGS